MPKALGPSLIGYVDGRGGWGGTGVEGLGGWWGALQLSFCLACLSFHLVVVI